MNRAKLREWDQRIQELEVRVKHLSDRVPLGVEPESLNWQEDLERLRAERQRLTASEQ